MMDGLFGLFSTKPAAPEVKEPKIRIAPNKRNYDGVIQADVYFYYSGIKSGSDVTRKVGYINAPIDVSGYIKTMVNNYAKPNEEAYYKISTSEVNQYIDKILFLEEPTERDYKLEEEIEKVGDNVILWVKVSDVNVVTTPPGDGGKKRFSKKKKRKSQRTKKDGKKSQRKKRKSPFK
jgi:hypothetical protein